jgi:GH15 family glucan-1,4-alpha-glucosidase
MTDREALVSRSVEVILGGQATSGAFIASPTFEQYSYAWLRDGAFIAEALDRVGEQAASRRFHDWVAAIILGAESGIERSIAAVQGGRAPASADYLHCRYELDGSPGPDDWPTFQLDGPGIWLWSLGHHVRHGGAPADEHRRAAQLAARYLVRLWDLPSYDAWEESPEHVHTSTMAGILAGLRAAEELLGADTPPGLGRATSAIERRLWSAPTGLVKWAGNDAVDGSLLWVAAPYGLLSPDEPSFGATLRRIEAELVDVDGGVHRYRADTYYGGGAWLLLTAALGRVYLRRGRPDDRARAESCRRWIEQQAGRDGALPEQVATRAFAPARIAEWVEMWGTSASPLLWSHAAYLTLVADLAAMAPVAPSADFESDGGPAATAAAT